MSDTLDKLTDTLGGLLRKAKEVGAQAVETVDRNGAVREAYARGTERTKAYGRMAKLSMDVNREREELRKIYTEIGKLYYEQKQNSAEGFFAPLFAQAGETAGRIISLEDELHALREEVLPDGAEKDIEVEIGAFDEIVSAEEDAVRGE